MTDHNRTIGAIIRANRLNRRLSQTQLGALVGCTKQAISAFETGAAPVSIGMLVKIAAALNAVVDIQMTPVESLK
jgi:transcriptional regulator with XRE-family HTH domain